MKEKMYRFAPAILFSGSLILCISIFFIVKYANINLKHPIHIAFITCQVITSLICGISIRKLHDQVYIDTLTGLCNRKFFNEKLYKMKTTGPISLILLDLDDFKNINDTYGHLMGDSVLQQFSEILKVITRKKDIIARWGGEEFAIILPGTSIEDACKIGNKIRLNVEKFIFEYENVTCNITVSIGIASTNTKTNIGIEQFLKVTDEALYRAKEKKNYISAVIV